MDASKELRLLLAFFGDAVSPTVEFLANADVPPPFAGLLAHDHHMTVTLEDYHGTKVRVVPYHVHRQGDMYGRKLDLFKGDTSTVVMTGAMLINLATVTPKVADEIVAGQTPLGRILIENDLFRRISGVQCLKLPPTEPLVARFGTSSGKPAYGRLATIYFGENPAVDLLEIVHPEL